LPYGKRGIKEINYEIDYTINSIKNGPIPGIDS